jgi:hypothetical protein
LQSWSSPKHALSLIGPRPANAPRKFRCIISCRGTSTIMLVLLKKKSRIMLVHTGTK